MIKFGIETIHNNKSTYKMFDSREAANDAGEKASKSMSSDDVIRLFYANCNAEGKLATNELHVVKEWFWEE